MIPLNTCNGLMDLRTSQTTVKLLPLVPWQLYLLLLPCTLFQNKIKSVLINHKLHKKQFYKSPEVAYNFRVLEQFS